MIKCEMCRDCAVCTQMRREARRVTDARYRSRRKGRAVDSSLCCRCFKRPQSDTSLMCVPCRDRHRKQQTKHRKTPARREKLRDYMRSYRAKLREARA